MPGWHRMWYTSAIMAGPADDTHDPVPRSSLNGGTQGRSAASSDPAGIVGGLLARELELSLPPEAPALPGELSRPWTAKSIDLRADWFRNIPQDPTLSLGSGLRRSLKRAVFSLTRPVRRRSDRQLAELAEMTARLAEEVEDVDGRRLGLAEEVVFLREQLDLVVGRAAEVLDLDRRLARLERVLAASDAGGAQLPDDFYWRFEERMRGAPEEVEAKLRQYEGIALAHLGSAQAAAATGADEGAAPLWVDAGCGPGLFARILREWGWRARGIDSSPMAVAACRAEGIEAEAGVLPDCLLGLEEVPAAISAIQVIEHLPRAQWLRFFRQAHRALADGGGLLVETINPLSPRALSTWFFADPTHLWPAHPATLAIMAESAGFQEIEILYLNPDGAGEAQDFALWARKR